MRTLGLAQLNAHMPGFHMTDASAVMCLSMVLHMLAPSCMAYIAI